MWGKEDFSTIVCHQISCLDRSDAGMVCIFVHTLSFSSGPLPMLLYCIFPHGYTISLHGSLLMLQMKRAWRDTLFFIYIFYEHVWTTCYQIDSLLLTIRVFSIMSRRHVSPSNMVTVNCCFTPHSPLAVLDERKEKARTGTNHSCLLVPNG